MKIEIEYLVKKQFAQNDAIYNVGDLIEMDEVEAKSLVDDGKIEIHKEEKSVDLKIDTKAISDAISEGLARFAPVPVVTDKKMGFGEFLKGIATKTVNITTNSQGKYITTEYVDPQIDADLLRSSSIGNLVTEISLSGTNNVFKMNVIDESVTPAVVVESVAFGTSQPTITQFSFTLVKIGTSYVASEESIEDCGSLVQAINATVPDKFSLFIEDGILNGNGALTGYITHTNTLRVEPEVGQSDFTIVAENLDNMVSSIKDISRAVWVCSRTAYTALLGVENSAGDRLWIGPNGISPAPAGTIYGIPIVISPKAQKLGTLGDLSLCNFKDYLVVNKGGLKMAQSSEVAFLEDNMTFKFRYRLNGGPVGLKLQDTDESYSASFVVLDTRDSATQSSSSSSS